MVGGDSRLLRTELNKGAYGANKCLDSVKLGFGIATEVANVMGTDPGGEGS